MVITVTILFSQLMLSGGTVSAQISTPDKTVSTYSELSAAISLAPTDGTLFTIEVTDDLAFAGTLTIASGKNIIIKTSESNLSPWELSRKNTTSTGRHFTVNGTLTLTNIVLDGDRENTQKLPVV